MLAPAPGLQAWRPAPEPTPTERQLTWATIILSLLAFWYGVGVAASALWGSFTG